MYELTLRCPRNYSSNARQETSIWKVDKKATEIVTKKDAEIIHDHVNKGKLIECITLMILDQVLK
jgi:hypothetical protein